jgi:hypothetical protein
MRFGVFGIALFLVFSVCGQSKDSINLRHQWLVGGYAKLFAEKIGAQNGRVIVEIDPQAGYFLSSSWAAGFRVPLSFTSDAYRIATNPFVRYYLPTDVHIRPFVEANGGRSWRSIYNFTSETYVLAEKSWLVGGQLGAAFFLSSKVSIDMYFYYTGQDGTVYQNGEPREAPFYHVFGLGGGILVYL